MNHYRNQDYFLGLDIGRSSIGWAVTDTSYQLLTVNRKDLWGVRLFNEAQTAEERRSFRLSRRIYDRRNWRLELLQSLFESAIDNVDDGFYMRMKESRYTPDDKRTKDGNVPALPYALFVDPDYTDKDYHKQFPTIYHLRQYLMTTEETPDIRLVYLGIHHILKHRGHFLLSGSISQINDFHIILDNFWESISIEQLDFHIPLTTDTIAFLHDLLTDKQLGILDKKKKIYEELKPNTICEKSILHLLVGGKVSLKDIFDDTSLEEFLYPSIKLTELTEDVESELSSILDERYTVILHAKAIYDWIMLSEILKNHKFLSEAKVSSYNKHKDDLAFLKKTIRTYCTKETYYEVFLDPAKDNYAAYVGSLRSNGKKTSLSKSKNSTKCTKDDFYSFLNKTVVANLPEGPEKTRLKEEMTTNSFLPKQFVKENNIIPHQLHLEELKQIIQNLQDRVPVLKEHADKIIKLLTFHVPYSVGPLNGIVKPNGKRTNWAVRKKQGVIYPWNFEEMIDIEKSGEQFVRRQTKKCTFLPTEDVLPKHSIAYERFMVLNELNTMKVNGVSITIQQKQRIYHDLFERHKHVTVKKLQEYLYKNGYVDSPLPDITGINTEFNSSLSSYHAFKQIRLDIPLTEEEQEIIIFNITIFKDDRAILKSRLSKLFPRLTEGQINAFCKFEFRGWGRLSDTLLNSVYAPAPQTGEKWSILDALWHTNDNLMALLSSKYRFMNVIKERSESKNDSMDIYYELLEDRYLAPSVKRSVWQALVITKELIHILGKAPKRVFIEVEKGENPSNKEINRKEQLKSLYKKDKTVEPYLKEELEQISESDLRSDKLYLYFLQKGRCMYSYEKISLQALRSEHSPYDKDHIYPRSKTLDDQLNNIVLVRKDINRDKDQFLLKKEIQQKMKPFWLELRDHHYLDHAKYDRLIREEEFTDSELEHFISSQLVEKRQSTKAVAQILEEILPKQSSVVYIKSKIVRQFRQDFYFPKVRDMNDLYHAKNAYLNIVTGNVYYLKFTIDLSNFVKKHKHRFGLRNLFKTEKNIIRAGETAWVGGDHGTIKTVARVMEHNNILVTRQTFCQKGALFDGNPLKKGFGQVPLKRNDERLHDINKYGGYNKATGNYFVLVQSLDKNGNPKLSLETILLHDAERFESNPNNIVNYFIEKGLSEPRIIIPKIKFQTIFRIDGIELIVTGRSGDAITVFHNHQLILKWRQEETLKKITKFVERSKAAPKGHDVLIVPRDDLNSDDTLTLYDAFTEKLLHAIYAKKLIKQGVLLEQNRDTFINLSLEDQCKLLYEVLHLFQCNRSVADLRMIGGAKNAGALTFSSNLSSYEHVSIIHQSPTGIFEWEEKII